MPHYRGCIAVLRLQVSDYPGVATVSEPEIVVNSNFAVRRRDSWLDVRNRRSQARLDCDDRSLDFGDFQRWGRGGQDRGRESRWVGGHLGSISFLGDSRSTGPDSQWTPRWVLGVNYDRPALIVKWLV